MSAVDLASPNADRASSTNDGAAPEDVGVVERPSGKGAKDENFPVGSWLLPKTLRPHVATYYAFARAIDDIADDPDLAADDKIARLQGMDAALRGEAGFDVGYEKARALRASMSETDVPTVHGSDLIKAFIQDCEKSRYQSWEELLGYCALSAAPVGRYLLDLHGEDRAGYAYSDALCTVLQIVNHLQDCGDDRRQLDRVYVIEAWLIEKGGSVADLDANAASPALRAVMDRMLDGCKVMMADARRLAPSLRSRRLAMESAVIVRLADRLIDLLRRGDPLASRVALSKLDFAVAGTFGVLGGFFGARATTRPVATRPGAAE